MTHPYGYAVRPLATLLSFMYAQTQQEFSAVWMLYTSPSSVSIPPVVAGWPAVLAGIVRGEFELIRAVNARLV